MVIPCFLFVFSFQYSGMVDLKNKRCKWVGCAKQVRLPHRRGLKRAVAVALAAAIGSTDSMAYLLMNGRLGTNKL